MRNLKFKTIPIIWLLLTFSSTFNCGTEKKEDQSTALIPLLALGSSGGSGGKAAGERCIVDTECAANLFCANAYNINTPYIYNLCTAVPAVSGTISGNGTGLSATLTSSSPVADFSVTINTPGKYTFSVTSTDISSSVVKPEISVYPQSGRTALLQATRNFSNNHQINAYNFSTPGTYRVRISTYYYSGSFGGGIRLFAANNAVASGGGSCTYTYSGKNRCDDYAVNSLLLNTYCTTYLGTGVTSANSCAVQNAAKTLIGRCTKGVIRGSTYGNGMVTRNYYDTSLLSEVTFDCDVDNGVQL
ncbi:hypothetical protein EHR01_08780 [Leptospira mtsangambouensis]|uniref:Lipoprotein n=1 Tax=Leptospira mtsangambouensis TaxID=2484912 RepID=A0ABY2NZZ8_9LEPT|nr:hypothetical protein [Leptospira mtsangambouensis]TGM77690.1 hypothetical protein EHR01_08780 [Leptospira mtsangambouensis]